MNKVGNVRISTQKWQKEWENCRKAAITKQFFPNVQDRVKLNINVNADFTAMVTGHGKTRVYLHRFKIIENATCPCNKGDQTIDHLLNQCTLLQTQLLRNNVLKLRKMACQQRGVNNETLEIISYFYKINRLWSLVTWQYIYIYIFTCNCTALIILVCCLKL